MPRRFKLTMDDVARAAGVSKQTVSAVVNNKSGISEKTREQIRKIMIRLDYQPNLLAGSLRGQSSFTIGVLIPSITNPFYPEWFCRGIEDEAQRRGYSLFLCNSDENPEKEVEYLQLLRRHRIAGLIVATIQVRPAWTEALKNLAAQRVPVVVLGASTERKRDPYCRRRRGGICQSYFAPSELGHDRIGMIMPPPDPNGESPRVTGFLRAYVAGEKRIVPELLTPGGWHVKDGRDGATRLMELPGPLQPRSSHRTIWLPSAPSPKSKNWKNACPKTSLWSDMTTLPSPNGMIRR